jgi:KDO2-lipid IV(A) lauroyltransferase
MSVLLFYLVVKPLSLLPFWMLYGISDFLYGILYKVFRYRVQVVNDNLTRSFPNKTKQEIHEIQNRFYRYFFDLMVETIKILSISKKQVIRRFKFENPEVLDRYFPEKKHVIIAIGHYGNWEYLAVSGNLYVQHQLIAIYFPLTNAFFDKKLAQARSKFGFGLIPTSAVKQHFNDPPTQPSAVFFGADQSPSNPRKAYWTHFLNQDTAVLFGTEKYACEFNQPVLFASIRQLKRGYYALKLEVLHENPKDSEYGEITELYVRRLEKQVMERPEHWLWSHKRWKRKKPADVIVPGTGNPNNIAV